MIITSLMENTRLEGREDLGIENGLCLHIQYKEHSILFDTGLSGNFLFNAEKLDIDIKGVTCAIISHHHFDHGGGIKRFFKFNETTDLWLGKSESKELWFRAIGILKKKIGLPWHILKHHTHRLRYVESHAEILPGVYLMTVSEQSHPLPAGNRYLLKRSEEGLVPDDFTHELIMVIREKEGLVIFSGCSHNGILNIIDTARKRFPEDPVKMIVGGFHLIDSPLTGSMAGTREEIEALGKQILAHDPDMVFTGHCTGLKAYKILKDVMGDRLGMLSSGTVIR